MRIEREGRRSALVRLVVGGAGLMTTALAGLVGLVASPPAGSAARRWRRALSSYEVADEPTEAIVAARVADGWYHTRRASVVYVDRDGDGFRALSATCAHLGCRVKWQTEAGQFKCPCHGGTYDREGRVVSGPPPGPLTRLNVRVDPDTADVEVEL